MTTLLVDADILAYKASAVGTESIAFDDDEIVTHADLNRCKKYVLERMAYFMDDLGASHAILCLSDNRNWRKSVYPLYKAQRPAPLSILPQVQEFIRETYDVKSKPGLEADDVMGILQTHPKLVPGEKIIVSEDKDMKSVPGVLFNPNEGKLVSITEQEADFHFLMQVLTGDTVDNYPGCPGIGPQKAKAILDGFGLLWPEFVWERVVSAYKDAGLSEEDALIQARVARICRASDYDFKNQRVILWNP